MHQASDFYGSTDKGLGLWRGQRKRLNFLPMVLSVVLPWALFVIVYAIMAFSFHYAQPLLSNVAVLLLLLGVLGFSCKAWAQRKSSERDPTWMLFIAASLLVAWLVAFLEGSADFSANTSPYYDLHNLNDYSDVNPNLLLGQQMQDAGIVTFAKGTQLDISKSMGFKNSDIYCVAPIVMGSTAPVSYDFWVVGTGCCSGYQADFHCTNADNPSANGGIRLMKSDRSFYRLAVQQAEATYGIKAAHPIFFTWEIDPYEEVSTWIKEAHNRFVVWMMCYLVAQLFFTTVAAVVFSKIGED